MRGLIYLEQRLCVFCWTWRDCNVVNGSTWNFWLRNFATYGFSDVGVLIVSVLFAEILVNIVLT